MLKSFFHNALICIVLILVAICFTFSANAASKEMPNNSRKQISAELIKKAKAASTSGNFKLAENYWLQAKSIDPTLTKPTWFDKKSYPVQKKTIQAFDENKFVEELQKMPYAKAKIELDKRLVFNPNNSKLRVAYLDLAEANGDEKEAARHRSILGIPTPTQNHFWLYFKYFLIILIAGLIIYELVVIIKPIIAMSRKPKEIPLPSNIRSI